MPQTENPGHLIKLHAHDILAAFLVDIGERTQNGLSPAHCETNKVWLRAMIAHSTPLPDSELQGIKIYQRWQAVFDAYETWNDRSKTPQQRARQLKRIQVRVNKLAGTFRKRISLLEDEVDIGVYRAIYSATEQAITAIPDILSAVAKALANYKKP